MIVNEPTKGEKKVEEKKRIVKVETELLGRNEGLRAFVLPFYKSSIHGLSSGEFNAKINFFSDL